MCSPGKRGGFWLVVSFSFCQWMGRTAQGAGRGFPFRQRNRLLKVILGWKSQEPLMWAAMAAGEGKAWAPRG